MNFEKQKNLFPLLTPIYIILIFVLISFNSFSQIPSRAVAIADSICKTRIYCVNTTIEFEDSIYYPVLKNKYQNRKAEIYYFTYKVKFLNNYVTNLSISIRQDFSIDYISGFPDSSHIPSPCMLLSKEKLWSKAREKGLKTSFESDSYSLFFSEEKEIIIISFHERLSRWDLDNYDFNAVTGEYLGHQVLNIRF